MRDTRKPDVPWIRDAEVFVRGEPDAPPMHSKEGLYAVLEVHPRDVKFQIGWRDPSSSVAEFYPGPAETENGMLAMGLHHGDVFFVAHPLEPKSVVIELVEIAPRNNLHYRALPHK
jgi:hypothetical protein